jgi:hypothetical protein
MGDSGALGGNPNANASEEKRACLCRLRASRETQEIAETGYRQCNVNRRFLLGASAAATIALVAGVVLGLSLRHDAKREPTAKSAFIASSRYVDRSWGHVNSRVLSGVMSSSPRWPFVIWQGRSENGSPRPYPVTFEQPVGPLRIIEGGGESLLLRSKDGYSYALERSSEYGQDSAPFLTTLGHQLDPEHLPKLSRLGVAVPVRYGANSKRKAVILVGLDRTLSPHLYGFLAGYSLPKPVSYSRDRPLLGQDHALYRIDRSARRLRLVTEPRVSRKSRASTGFTTTCYSVSAGSAGTYEGCPGKIDLVHPDGTRTTLYAETTFIANPRWCEGKCIFEIVIPSPDRRTLLVQEGFYGGGCGVWESSFLSAAGGKPRSALPSPSIGNSWALGWLNADTALLAADAPGECFRRSLGIYITNRTTRFPQLILATTSNDATIWRSG